MRFMTLLQAARDTTLARTGVLLPYVNSPPASRLIHFLHTNIRLTFLQHKLLDPICKQTYH
jgi:hypothetical protein